MSATLLTFVHISDTHLLRPDERKDFTSIEPKFAQYAEQILAQPYHTSQLTAALIEQINTLPSPIDFVLHTGDVAGESATDYETIAHLLRQIRYPSDLYAGNHDNLPGIQQWLCPQHVPESANMNLMVCRSSHWIAVAMGWGMVENSATSNWTDSTISVTLPTNAHLF